MPDEYTETATWDGAPRRGDLPIALDRFIHVLPIDRHTAYKWSARDVLPPHDGMCGRSRYWWSSKLVAWYRQRHPTTDIADLPAA